MAQQESIRVVSFGLGPIGLETAKHILNQSDMELVGAIDIDPSKVGKTLGKLFGDGPASEVRVRSDADEALEQLGPDVVVHTTASWLRDVEAQFHQILKHGCHVVSSTEELAFPSLAAGVEVARRLNERALGRGRSLLPVGVNPGFVMDHMCLQVARCCLRVDRVLANRVVDATRRRGPLQRKIGSGMTVQEFENEKRKGRLGHAGFRESVALIAHGLGWTLDRIEMTLDPIVAESPIQTDFVRVQPGQVAGIDQTAGGIRDGREDIRLHIIMSVAGVESNDEIFIEGDPPFRCRFEGGVHGDSATVALLVDAVRRVRRFRPGLLTPSGEPLFL